MNAPTSFKLLTPVRSWHDLVSIARRNVEGTLAAAVIEQLRVEAELSSDPQYTEWRLNKVIAEAAQGFLDCPCEACLDEIDMLMDDDVPELSEARPEYLSPAVYGNYR